MTTRRNQLDGLLRSVISHQNHPILRSLSIRINLHIKNFSIHASTAHSAASLSVCLSGNSRGAILSQTFSWIYSLLNQFETLSFGSGILGCLTSYNNQRF